MSDNDTETLDRAEANAPAPEVQAVQAAAVEAADPSRGD